MLWAAVRSLEARGPPALRDISFGKQSASAHHRVARLFNVHFSTPVPHRSSRDSKTVLRAIRSMPQSDSPSFSAVQVAEAIAAQRSSTAIGPDGLSVIHLKHLGPKSHQFLASLFNASLSQNRLPQVWKFSRLVPLLKAGKPPGEHTSYRPISLLSPVVKTLERLLLPLLETHLPLPPHQHGFRRGRSSSTALSEIVSQVGAGFNQKRPAARSVVAALDLSRAFDTVDPRLLVASLSHSSLPRPLLLWLSNYLSGRRCSVSYQGSTSGYRSIRYGVPQGSVLSPLLFAFFTSDIPVPHEPVSIITYADDITLVSTAPSLDAASAALSAPLADISLWARGKGLQINAKKSSVSPFSSDTHEHEYTPEVRLGSASLPVVKNPKILGLTLDPSLSFSSHCHSVANKTRPRLSLLRLLSSRNYALRKESLLMLYKTLIRSVLEYAHPVWYPSASYSSVRRLQVVQNASLRAATGCVASTPSHHLHDECSTLPLSEHLQLLSSQFFLSALCPSHPNHAVHIRALPPRQTVPTLRSLFATLVRRKLDVDTRTPLPPAAVRVLQTRIHSHFVSCYMKSRTKNSVLSLPAPVIAASEATLPSAVRRSLAQLRSGLSPLLASYRHLLDPAVPASCPHCGSKSETTLHLLTCPARPKPPPTGPGPPPHGPGPPGVDALLLWSDPVSASRLFGLLPAI